MINQELLDVLVCPNCKGDLKFVPNSENKTKGALNCFECKLSFRIEDDIPIMLVDEAQKLTDEKK